METPIEMVICGYLHLDLLSLVTKAQSQESTCSISFGHLTSPHMFPQLTAAFSFGALVAGQAALCGSYCGDHQDEPKAQAMGHGSLLLAIFGGLSQILRKTIEDNECRVPSCTSCRSVRKVLQLLRLKQLHNGVFLKARLWLSIAAIAPIGRPKTACKKHHLARIWQVNKPILNMLKLVQPYVTYGFPSLKTVRELIYKRGFGKVINSESHRKLESQVFFVFWTITR